MGDILLVILLPICGILLVVGLVKIYIYSDPLRKQMEEVYEIEERSEANRIRKERKEAKLKAQLEWDSLLESRRNKYGILTKQIDLRGNKNDNIFVYEEGRVLFIQGDKYSFKDILSCSVEKLLVTKGKTTYTTTPDKGEMAREQVLWGMGQSYNVKSTTQAVTTPDVYKYVIYIGINSISSPQIQLSVSSSSLANEINNLMNVIINVAKN